jgi:hypothetical protein
MSSVDGGGRGLGGARRKRAGGRERAEENASVSVCVLPSVCECVHLCTCVCAPCDGATSSGADAANLSSGFQLRILLISLILLYATHAHRPSHARGGKS